jgi:nucleoside-diphosphate-sugar epimerase
MKEKILIIGANGFIGSHIVEEACKSGMHVYAGVRKNSDIDELLNQDCSILEIDYNDINDISDIFRKQSFDYVIHNAGITKSLDNNEYLKINHGLLVNVIKGIQFASAPIKKFIYMSSLAAFGPADNQPNGIVSNNSKPKPITKYGLSKLAAENFLKEQLNIPYIIIRPTATYGPKEKDLFNVFLMAKNRIELIPGIVSQKLTFVYVRDLAKLLILAAKSNKSRHSYFVTDGHIYTSDALSGFIKQNLNKWTIKIKVPIPVLKVLAFITEKISAMWGIYPSLNIDKVNDLKARSWVCDISNLYSDLGFKAEYDLTKGIPETIQWYKANKWL